MSAPSEPVRLVPMTMADLKRLVEGSVLSTGVEIYDAKLVLNVSRSGRRLYADVKGRSTNPYTVVIDLAGEGRDLEKVRCTCPAARFRGAGVCKHGAAVLVAWASGPGSFVEVPAVALEAEEPEPKKPKRGVPKRGQVDAEEQIRKGLASLETLLAELAHTGLGTLTHERVNQIREVAKNLRPLGLRRLAPACLELADILEVSLTKHGDFSANAYAQALAVLTFHIRGLARLIERTDTPAEDYRRLADELLGRTWSEKGLTTVAGLRLLDLGYRKRATPDGFVLEESLLVDVATGDLVVDRLIRPPIIAKRQPPKENFDHVVLAVSDAGVYPGYPPRRIKLRAFDRRPPTPEDVSRLLSSVPDSADSLLSRLKEYVADIFAPRPMMCVYRPASVFVEGHRIYGVDRSGNGVEIALGDIGLDVLERAFENGPIQLIAGSFEMGKDSLVIVPFSILTGDPQRPALTSLPQE